MNRILIFGDSIVAGRYINKNHSWPSLLKSRFDQTDNNNTTVFNLGIPGDNLGDLLKRFDNECMARINHHNKTDMISIIIAIGLNDAKNNQSDSFKNKKVYFEQNLIKLIGLAQKYTQNIIFLGCTRVDENKLPPDNKIFTNNNIRATNNIIKKICLKNNLQYMPIFEKWQKSFLGDDGIHPNVKGHKYIYNIISSNAYINNFDPFCILKKELSLSYQDVAAIKKIFIENNVYDNELFIGQFNYKKTQVIVGAPCIRNDIKNISLNTFYQIFLPLKIASTYKIPIIIFLGIQEEIILQPKLMKKFIELKNCLLSATEKIAKDLKIPEVKIIDTSTETNNIMIEITRKVMDVKLTVEESSNLYNLSIKPRLNPTHLPPRINSNCRIIACNTTYTISKLYKKLANFLIIEDIEQYKCTRFASRFDKLDPPNFLGFLPLPNIKGTKTMFKSENDEKLFLGKKQEYYAKTFKKIKPDILAVYAKLLSIFDDQKDTRYCNYPYFLKTINKISKYFNQS